MTDEEKDRERESRYQHFTHDVNCTVAKKTAVGRIVHHVATYIRQTSVIIEPYDVLTC